MNDEFRSWADQVMELHIPRWDELPEIDLYMDQVVRLIENYLGIFFIDEKEKMLTKAMVNNYVKQQLLPPPNKKLYSRRHVAFLIAITILKRIVTIKEVKDGITYQAEYQGEKRAYNFFCDQVELEMKRSCLLAQQKKVEAIGEIAPEETILRFAANALASKIITEKIIQTKGKERN